MPFNGLLDLSGPPDPLGFEAKLLMDAFRLCVAVEPLAIYLLVLGAINLSRHPLVISGGRDLAGLGVGVSGMVLVGPIELLLPRDAIFVYGAYVWLLALAMYGLCLTLAILMASPRLTVYNLSLDEFRPLLVEAVGKLDAAASWAGDTVALPGLHMELHVEATRLTRTISLVSIGDRQSYSGWKQLEHALAGSIASVPTRRSPFSIGLLIGGVILMSIMGWQLTTHMHAVNESFRDAFRMDVD